MGVAEAAEAELAPGDRDLVRGVLGAERRALAKCITLLESTRHDHQARARRVLAALLTHTGNSIRVGITGAPGAGKSTFIEALGLHLIERGHRVAVLAVDPSSSRSGGSILGDKTRMECLSQRTEAFIRPSPSRGSLGGVAEKTREALLVCEAAGFDVVIVETVGVGQSETAVAGMTDVFVLLQLPNSGDELQAIKKGVVELADIVVYNKSDLDPDAARRAGQQMKNALGLLQAGAAGWHPPVLTVSSRDRTGIADFWSEVERHRTTMIGAGEFAAKRQRQSVDWMWSLIDAGLRRLFREHSAVTQVLDATVRAVAAGRVTPNEAAHRLLAALNISSPSQGEDQGGG